MNEAKARAYLSAHLAGLREPCPGVWCRAGSKLSPPCTQCFGTGEVARDWRLEDLLEAMEAAGFYYETSPWGKKGYAWCFWRRPTIRGDAASPIIAAALALGQEEKP